MSTTLLTGIIGSLTLVTGAAWPVRSDIKTPLHSIKNWLFAVGNVLMFTYALLNFYEGGSIFFVLLACLTVFASTLMMFNVKDIINTVLILLITGALVVWSIYLFEDYTTIFFILGLGTLALGYSFDMATIRRLSALTLGSALLSYFSYGQGNMIFFWLNLFFAIFSGYYLSIQLAKKE